MLNPRQAKDDVGPVIHTYVPVLIPVYIDLPQCPPQAYVFTGFTLHS